MKNTTFYVAVLMLAVHFILYSSENIILNPPDTSRGIPVMQALAQRASASVFDTSALNIQDLSDLLWAANGVNRPGEGKRTAASAMNAQDIDIYVAMESGVYLYNATEHLLEFITDGDQRNIIAGAQPRHAVAPVIFLLVSDISRFRAGDEAQKMEWAALDAGLVAQNIMIFCASEGFAVRPRAWMDREKLREVLMLSDTQYLLLNLPVSR